MTPTTADIRRFLVNTFSDEDLKTLCFDYFRDVYDDFTTGMTKGQMIQLLIERCVRRDALANLDAALRAERPDQYVKQFGALTPPPVSSTIPAETAPAGHDPRQVFISHAHQDAEFAHRLAADLQRAGWRVWIAPDSIHPGERWVEAIGRGLDGSGVFLVVLTPAALGSRWVRKETYDAIDLEVRGEVRFVPLELEACIVPTMWGSYQRVSFRSRYEDGLRALLSRLSGTPDTTSAARTSEAVQPTKQSQGRAPVLIKGTPGTPVAFPSRAAPAAGPIAFDWVTIPAGDFLMGSDKQKDKLADDNETPQHSLYLSEYRIARVPVTVAQFAVFVKATGFDSVASLDLQRKGNHPITDVSWHDALAFCNWADVRLPTEAEWEKAARGTDGRIWSWGNQQPTDELCNFNNKVRDTTPVVRYPDSASPFGVLDMTGNVWEWTSSLRKSYKYDAQDGREDPEASGVRVLRGGAFRNGAQVVRCAYRSGFKPHYRGCSCGFRVVSPGC